jgi:multidrug transporter EmrE-like cation transporter
MTAMQQGTNYALLTGSFVLSATLLFVNNFQLPAAAMGIMALLMAIVLIRHLRRIEKSDRMF